MRSNGVISIEKANEYYFSLKDPINKACKKKTLTLHLFKAF
jgi:hypothetical protein